MSKDLHIVPKLPLPEGQKWDNAKNCLTLSKSATFTVTIANIENYMDSMYSKPKSFTPVRKEVYDNMTLGSKNDYKRKFDEYNEAEDAYEKNVTAERAKIQWAWQLVNKGIDPAKLNHNNSFSLGISTINEKQITFPKLLEGGGLTWLEIFTDENSPIGKPPHGMFVRATGTPKVIAAEWRDYTGKLITEEIAFGSTVYLHIYTQALYGENIQIQLRDTKLANADLTPTPSDADGDPVQKLEPKPLTRFTRPVSVHKYDESTKPPSGTVTDAIITDKGEEQISNSNVQKCVFPVFIEQAWQFQGAGSFDSGSKLSINPIVYHNKIENQKIDLDSVLKVSKNGILMQGELSGNNPLMLSEAEKGDAPEEQKKIDFTFGVFIDGTLNNMYNSIARQSWEDDQINKRHSKVSYEQQRDYIEDPEEHLKVNASSQKQVGKVKESRYKYSDESSYENDLSNPAIIYKNYLNSNKNKLHPIFKIYTEGMGTNTLNDGKDDENDKNAETGILPLENYITDDIVEGTGFGQGKAGILDRVKRAIELMSEKIKATNQKELGTITVDVFGFSRGAASARCFVHEITRQSYIASTSYDNEGIAHCTDANGYDVNEKYSREKLPTNGRLGYMLTEEKITFDKLIIRFAGLYDTVPHHGLVQWNDVKDLGLNSISKAKYTVHMVAADEHRANFNLVDISCITGKKGGGKTDRGIELYLPGVHCDVGGSYVEGRSEVNGRIMVSPLTWGPDLEKEQERLISEGWFKKKELTIHWDNAQRTIINGVARVLSSNREAISNQYSYIPLHLMAKFCLDKEVPIYLKGITDAYDFKNTKFSSISFLEKIKARLEQYAFHDGQPLIYETVSLRTNTNNSDDPIVTIKEEEEEERKKEEDKLNTDLKKLRHDYLHWNAIYGEGFTNTLVQPNKPNFEGNQRKRVVNG
ncbi:DUF2235 domain-containing protein [Flavobacterium sp. ANB]|uniref:T6SS phospholipase effector Tle1-like catalytic domain-containing protein n=1 Tax=Flavobacterium sp. ANB TaxID=2783790 RepID=UPI00188C1ACA|nr:DUF2235 domain-containing protein [Flavobacterium sp. ANB]MBF4517904.1 DUF2235 domain-containing protein [Flavobacterium sp. ANB]